jgi:hypothetical protein
MKQTSYHSHFKIYHKSLLQAKMDFIKASQKTHSYFGASQLQIPQQQQQQQQQQFQQMQRYNPKKKFKFSNFYLNLGKRDDEKVWCRCIVYNCNREVNNINNNKK